MKIKTFENYGELTDFMPIPEEITDKDLYFKIKTEYSKELKTAFNTLNNTLEQIATNCKEKYGNKGVDILDNLIHYEYKP